MPTLVERMETMMRFFGFTHKQRPNELSANALATYIGMTHPPVVKWMRGDLTVDLVDVCDRLGVSFDWVVGRSSRMWSESFEETRREIRAKLARRDWSNSTRTLRVAQALDMARATDFRVFTCELISSVLRLDEKTLRAIQAGETSVSSTTVKRLSEWLGVPIAWFETGDTKTLVDKQRDWDRLAEFADVNGIDPDEVMRFIATKVKIKREAESLQL
jgi:transcriptional regulator with XRE-family HTH domain